MSSISAGFHGSEKGIFQAAFDPLKLPYYFYREKTWTVRDSKGKVIGGTNHNTNLGKSQLGIGVLTYKAFTQV